MMQHCAAQIHSGVPARWANRLFPAVSAVQARRVVPSVAPWGGR